MGGVAFDEAIATAIRATLEAAQGAVAAHRVGPYPQLRRAPRRRERLLRPRHLGRLRRVKALYDPQDLFKGNHHIPPAERP